MISMVSMAAPVVASLSSDAFESLTRRARPKISIELAGQQEGLVSSYTTGDSIQGTVEITVDQDVAFDAVTITFEGAEETVHLDRSVLLSVVVDGPHMPLLQGLLECQLSVLALFPARRLPRTLSSSCSSPLTSRNIRRRGSLPGVRSAD